MERDLVHVIASDMHNLDHRPPHMEEAYDIIAKNTVKIRLRNFLRIIPENNNGSIDLGEKMKEQNMMEIDVFHLLKILWKRKIF